MIEYLYGMAEISRIQLIGLLGACCIVSTCFGLLAAALCEVASRSDKRIHEMNSQEKG